MMMNMHRLHAPEQGLEAHAGDQHTARPAPRPTSAHSDHNALRAETARRYTAIVRISFVRGSSLWTMAVAGEILPKGDVLQHDAPPSFPRRARTELPCILHGIDRRIHRHTQCASARWTICVTCGTSKPDLAAARPPWINTSPGVPRNGKPAHRSPPQSRSTLRATSSMEWDDQDDRGAPGFGDSAGSCSRMAIPPPGIQSGSGLVQNQHLRLHGHARRRWPPGASGRRKVQRATFQSVSSGRFTASAGGIPDAPVDLLLRPAPCSSGRRRCPCTPSPQRADTPGTGTPAPPESGSARMLLGLRPDILSRARSTWPEVGFSRPFRCWIRVDFPEPVWPMMPTISPG